MESSVFTSKQRTSPFVIKTSGKEEKLLPEPQTGNTEYKLKIINPTPRRFEHLVSQMKWRLQEGDGEAVYKIGVLDNGVVIGICEDDMKQTMQVLEKMAQAISATTRILSSKEVSHERNVAEVQVQSTILERNDAEIRIGVLGSTDAGKSTLLGVLTTGCLDNGRGKARLTMFRHLHEIRSGNTSTISHETLTFDSTGKQIYNEKFSASLDTSKNHLKSVTFLDLPGHRKFFKTTLRGILSYQPHYAILVVSSTAGITTMTKEHISVLQMLKVPFFIVIAKADLNDYQIIYKELKFLLKQTEKKSLLIETYEEVTIATIKVLLEDCVPVFSVSSVTSTGLEVLSKFIYILSSNKTHKIDELCEISTLRFLINEVFKSIDDEYLLGGLLVKGVLKEGLQIKIGPFQNGNFMVTKIKSIHHNRSPVKNLHPDQNAVIRLTNTFHGVRNGMVLLSEKENGNSCLYFKAIITVLCHPTEIYPGFQTTLYICNVRQVASIFSILDGKCVKVSETATVIFKFLKHPESLIIGQMVIFQTGPSKGVGEVTEIFCLT